MSEDTSIWMHRQQRKHAQRKAGRRGPLGAPFARVGLRGAWMHDTEANLLIAVRIMGLAGRTVARVGL